MQLLFTDDERAIRANLDEVRSAFLELPVEHPDERDEFCAAVRDCQNVILARAHLRAMLGSEN